MHIIIQKVNFNREMEILETAKKTPFLTFLSILLQMQIKLHQTQNLAIMNTSKKSPVFPFNPRELENLPIYGYNASYRAC